MTVRELIKLLENLPPDVEIEVSDAGMPGRSIRSVELMYRPASQLLGPADSWADIVL